MKNMIKDEKSLQIEKNIMFVSTIYDSFEALEETLDKLKIDESRILITKAKKKFADEVIKYAVDNNIYVSAEKNFQTKKISLN